MQSSKAREEGPRKCRFGKAGCSEGLSLRAWTPCAVFSCGLPISITTLDAEPLIWGPGMWAPPPVPLYSGFTFSPHPPAPVTALAILLLVLLTLFI